MQKIASERLQELLDWWKDECSFINEYARLRGTEDGLAPQIRNWRSLESYIFDQRNEEFDTRKWNHVGEVPAGILADIYPLLPFEFFMWNRKSRRAIHLPIELQRPFSVAPLGGVRFADVRLPFESFILTLEEPLETELDPGLWTKYDAIWVTQIRKTRDIRCRLLRMPHVPPEQRRLPKAALRSLEIARRRGDDALGETFLRVKSRWLKTMVDIPGNITFDLHSKYVREDDFVEDHVTPEFYARKLAKSEESMTSEECAWRGEWLCAAAKIVIGWCVCLKTLPSESYVWEEPPPRSLRGTRGSITGVITDPAHICRILRIGTMDIDKYREKNPRKEGSRFFQWPHVRSGHWKRERGAGPRAPKTVWIEAYEVRKDLMPLFGIHGGKITKVEGDL